MREVTPISDQSFFERLVALAKRPKHEVWREEIALFVEYLTAEDDQRCKIPQHDAYLTQRRLTVDLQRALPAEGRLDEEEDSF